MPHQRAIVIVLDGCGAGVAPDAARFGDTDSSHTLRHVWEVCGGLQVPNLRACGFFGDWGLQGATPLPGFRATYARLRPCSMGGKDSVTGHWEMMGVVLQEPFPTYPEGFPEALVRAFESRIGRKILGNIPASGTEIIAVLGEEHMATGRPIVYTSADSVFQIACHEDIVSVDILHEWCIAARELCVAPNLVQRVIARPFIGKPNRFTRTERRKDYPAPPPTNLIDRVGSVRGIGVVPDLFAGRGFIQTRRTQSNIEHMGAMREALADTGSQFIFANFEDFDMLYGHRNDPKGFGRALEQFDEYLAEILRTLKPSDLLMLTADHGNDPTTLSTDHSREFVPGCAIQAGTGVQSLGDLPGFSAIGATVAAWLDIPWDTGTPLVARAV